MGGGSFRRVGDQFLIYPDEEAELQSLIKDHARYTMAVKGYTIPYAILYLMYPFPGTPAPS